MELLSIIVGFIGVIITLLGNAYLARRQQKDQVKASQRALRRVLLGELKSLSVIFNTSMQSLESKLEANKKGGNWGAMGASMAETPVYLASLSQLGRLTESEVAAVIDAYQAVLGQDRKIRIMPGNIPKGEEGVYIPPENLALSIKLLATIPPEIARAVRELEKN